MARLRWQGRSGLVFAAVGTTAAAAVAAVLFLAPQPASVFDTARHAQAQVIGITRYSVPKCDLAFVAACSSQRAQYESAQPIADPTAEIVAVRVDEAGAAGDRSDAHVGDTSNAIDTE